MTTENKSFFKRWGDTLRGVVVRFKNKLADVYNIKPLGFKGLARKQNELFKKHLKRKTEGR